MGTSFLPVDSQVLIGKLSNGLTYYIRKNSEPKNRVELRLVVHAGSLQEDSDQLGLAHFTEHMAFNGTEHFSRGDLVNFLEKAGIKFGADLNARTSFEETVYQLSLPTDSTRIPGDTLPLFEKGFQIMNDWAHSLRFQDSAVQKERGIVIEEWRLGRGANARLRDQYFPVVFKGSQYAQRLPIGTKKSLDSFNPERLKQFYKDWYRPDLEAIVVVGDISPKKAEELIKKYFSGLKNPEVERPRLNYPVPANKEMRIAILTDKEQPYTLVQWVNKLPKASLKTEQELTQSMEKDLFNLMMKNRIAEILQVPDAPFLFASSSYSPLFSNLDAFQNFALVKGGKEIIKGVKALSTEILRVKKYGFLPSELERAKKDYQGTIEKSYQERDKTNSKILVNDYVENFLRDLPIPGIEYKYHFVEANSKNIALASIQDRIKTWFGEDNRYLIVTAPEKEKANLPSGGEIFQALRMNPGEIIKPYKDTGTSGPLMDKIPTYLAPKKVREYPSLGITEYALANGIQVLVKPTSFKNDQVLFTGIRKGGTSFFSDKQYLDAVFSAPVVDVAGIGKFDNNSLRKTLAGKELRVSPFIEEYVLGISGNSTPKDLETSFQLTYLYFTNPRKDVKSFTSLVQKESAIRLNQNVDPAQVFSDSVSAIMSRNNIRNISFKPEDINRINLDSAFDHYQKSFSNPSEFHFIYVGNFTLPQMEKYLGTYLATIPVGKGSFHIKDDLNDYPTGNFRKILVKGKEPKTQVRLIYTGKLDYNQETEARFNLLLNGLEIKLRENLREDKSGTYGVGVSGELEKQPRLRYHVQISFGCAPERMDSLIKAVKTEVALLKKTGLDAAHLEKIKNESIRSRELALQRNEFWLNHLVDQVFNQEPLENILQAKNWELGLDQENSRALANAVFGDNLAEIILNPEPKK